GRPRLLLDASQPSGVVGDLARESLESHAAREPLVASPIDFSRAAGSERAEHFVGPEAGPRYQRRAGSGYPVVEAVDPVFRNSRKTIRAGPILITSRSESRAGFSILRPRTYVPFLLPRSSIVAPSSSTAIRACRRETDASSIQTTAPESRPVTFPVESRAI